MARLTPAAQGDLDDIWDYTAENWGVDQAEAYIRQLACHIDFIAERPAIGRACPDIRPGYSKYASGLHVIFYRLVGHDIEVVRILHGRMDMGQHL